MLGNSDEQHISSALRAITVLEAIAAASELPAVGSELRVDADETLAAQRSLAATIALTWRGARAPTASS